MYANYVTVSGTNIDSLGWGTAYRDAVMGDWVGLYTGTITTTSQLSDYADKANCFIQGTAGDWTVYDADAHPTYPGQVKVLRRLCTDGVNYQYMLIGFDADETRKAISFAIGYCGGWDATNKTPTTTLFFTHDDGSIYINNIVESGTAITETVMPFFYGTASSSSWYSGYINSTTGEVANFFNPQFSSSLTVTPMAYTLLNTPALSVYWANAQAANSTSESFSMGIVAEHDGSHPWSNPANGVVPIVFGGSMRTDSYTQVRSPLIRNQIGVNVTPSYTALGSIAGSDTDSGTSHGTFRSPSQYLHDKIINASGEKVIPVVPIDVTQRISTNGHFCYAGRLTELFATNPNLQVGDTFMVGTDTFVVIPTGEWSRTISTYSPLGKLCARIQ